MIFVTVGTTRFDDLVEAMDKIAPNLEEEVVVQVGNSEYTPRNCTYFTFDDDLFKYYERADIVVAHGGAGITFEVLNLGKKLISIDNSYVLDGHQRDLLGRLSQDEYLVWCKDLNTIENCIKDVKRMEIKKYVRPECKIAEMIVEYLK